MANSFCTSDSLVLAGSGRCLLLMLSSVRSSRPVPARPPALLTNFTVSETRVRVSLLWWKASKKHWESGSGERERILAVLNSSLLLQRRPCRAISRQKLAGFRRVSALFSGDFRSHPSGYTDFGGATESSSLVDISSWLPWSIFLLHELLLLHNWEHQPPPNYPLKLLNCTHHLLTLSVWLSFSQ